MSLEAHWIAEKEKSLCG